MKHFLRNIYYALNPIDPNVLIPCVPHPDQQVGIQTDFFDNELMMDKGIYTYQYSGGSQWQRHFTDYWVAFINQIQTSVKFRRVSSGADITIGFIREKGSYSYVGKGWEHRKGNLCMNLGGVQKDYLSNHNKYYVQHVIVHEFFHKLGYHHSHESWRNDEYYKDRKMTTILPVSGCGIMSYPEEKGCEHPLNWYMISSDYTNLWSKQGKPDRYLTMKDWELNCVYY